MDKYIKSPLNYTGNKFRILPQIVPHFPKKIGIMVDLFCGGATVGLNVDCEKVYFVDNNERVIDLLVFLSKQNFEDLVLKIEEVIEKYKLSNSFRHGYSLYRQQCCNNKDNNGLKDFNREPYYALRQAYNQLSDKSTSEANIMLYTLMIYAFNNDIRFNSDGDFNLPVGKTDFNSQNVNRLRDYIERVNNLNAEFVCTNFNSPKMKELVDVADFVYMDPPYLLGDAVYNSSWNNTQEYELLDFIESLEVNNKNYALSNVMQKTGRINEPLSYWCHKHQDKVDVIKIDYNYKSASYNKKNRDAKEQEVLVVRKRKVCEDK